MADISVEFSVVDRFTEAMNKFSEMVEKCAGGADNLAESANTANEKIEKINESTDKGGASFKGFGASMMIMNQAMQAFSRIAEPVKQALDDIATKQRVVIMFGKEAGYAFNKFAQSAAMSMGRVEGEIRKAGLKWQKIGIGGDNIMELTRLADRFANLNPDRSFEDVAETFKEAVKSKDIGGLADLLGGGEGVEIKLRRAGVERMMRSGNISGALERFKKVADGFGYTQEKADEMGMTIDRKLQKIATLGRNYLTEMFSDVVKKAEPYVNRLLEWLQSEDVKEGLEKFKVLISNIADGFLKLAAWVINVVKAVHDFVSENAGLLTIVGTVIGGYAAFVKLRAGILGVIPVIKKMNFALLKSPLFIIPAVALGAVKIFQVVFNKITGASLTFTETLVGIFVGGSATIGAGIVAGFQYAWNGIVSGAEWAVNGIDEIITDFLNACIDKFEWLRDGVLGVWDEVVGGIKKLNPFDGMFDGVTDTLKAKGILKDIPEEASKPAPIERFQYSRHDFSNAKANPINPADVGAKATEFVMGKINGLTETLGKELFGDVGNDIKDIKDELGALSGMQDDLGNIRGSMQKEQDLRWMKEMAEQRFVNEVNLRQLTPTINLQVKGANASPQAYAKALARELQQMADAGTYNAYGDAV